MHREIKPKTLQSILKQDGIINKVKANWPLQVFVVCIKPALNQIADHSDQFIETSALRRHLRLMANGNQHVFVFFNLKNEFLFHNSSLTRGDDFDKAGERTNPL